MNLKERNWVSWERLGVGKKGKLCNYILIKKIKTIDDVTVLFL